MCGNRLEKVAKKITRSFFLFAQVAHPEVAWAHAPARLEVDRAQEPRPEPAMDSGVVVQSQEVGSKPYHF